MRTVFSVNKHGDEMAKQLAINARRRGLDALEGVYWRSERGLLVHCEESIKDFSEAGSAVSKASSPGPFYDVA